MEIKQFIARVGIMFRQFIAVFIFLVFSPFIYADIASDLAADVPAAEAVANAIAGLSPDEIAALADEIAQALRDAGLSESDALQAMTDGGIPQGVAFTSVVQSYRLAGTRLAALAQYLRGVGGAGAGGGGTPVSP